MNRRIYSLYLAVLFLLISSTTHALTPIHKSSVRYGGAGGDGAYSVAVDVSGNVYVAGVFQGNVAVGGGMLISAGLVDIFLAKYNSAGVHQWSFRVGGTGIDEPHAIDLDASGNVYVTGNFSNTVNFGGANLVSAGNFDIFLAKYSTTGVHQWSQRFGSTDWDHGMSLAVDNSGVVLAGDFRGSVHFGGGVFGSLGESDIILAKYELPNGGHMWSESYGDVGIDVAYSVDLTASGNVILTGAFDDNITFYDGPTLFSQGSSDVFVAMFDAISNHLWSFRSGGPSADFGSGIATSGAEQNVVVTGGFMDIGNFGGSDLGGHVGNYDVWVAKYDASGNHLWSRAGGGNGNDASQAITTDAYENVYVTGFFGGSATFGADFLPGSIAPDMFLSRYSATGVHHWSKGFAGTSTDIGRGIAIDNAENAVVVGDFWNSVDFGGGNLMSAGSSDVVILKYDQYTSEPLITSIKDIGNDQGRKVQVRFDRSASDAVGAGTPITRYVAFRKDKAAPAPLAAPGNGEQLIPGWTEVGWVNAFGDDSYGIDVPTVGDSTIAQGPYNSTFLIRAATNTPTLYYESRVDSGYSKDNLDPGIPLNFIYNAGDLTWDESDDEDFDYFTVYGANVDAFGSATVVDYTVAPVMDVTSSPYVFYFVTATDFSGNEGKPARVNTLSGVSGTPSRYVLSVANYPNPFNPRTTVSYTVPARGRVTVAVYDLRGAHVATLFEGERPTGAYSVEWDGRSAGGASVSSGVYFARIEQNGASRTKKMVLLK